MLDHVRYPCLDLLANDVNGLRLYNAGLPRFPRLFPRDLLFSAFLFRDRDFLADVLEFCAAQQGTKRDAFTGEEPGKIPHEIPGVVFVHEGRPYSTQFSAADTTAAYLIGLGRYRAWGGDASFVMSQKDAALRALDHILAHLDGNAVFWIDPARSGAERYALRVTYWKDSSLPGREDGAPLYPIAYSLVQAMASAALHAAAGLSGLLGLDGEMLERRAQEAARSLWSQFWDAKRGTLCLGIDQAGMLREHSSDCLHALYYLRRSEVPSEKALSLAKSARALETPFGYRTLAEGAAGFSAGSYHLGSLWPFEQAFIAEAGRMHSMARLRHVAGRVMGCLGNAGAPGGYPEVLRWERGMPSPALQERGCHTQLWTVAAHHYFSAQHTQQDR